REVAEVDGDVGHAVPVELRQARPQVVRRIRVELALDGDDSMAIRGADVEAHVGGWVRTPAVRDTTALCARTRARFPNGTTPPGGRGAGARPARRDEPARPGGPAGGRRRGRRRRGWGCRTFPPFPSAGRRAPRTVGVRPAPARSWGPYGRPW